MEDLRPRLQLCRFESMGIGDERYVLLTTYRRDGRAVQTPVWWVDLDGGEYGFWTSSASGKAKRLAHTARVTVQPCNARGTVTAGAEPVEGSARLVTGPELDELKKKVVAKYGFQTKITKMLGKAAWALKGKNFPYGDRGVIVTL
jgi:PPOX class probable F420-dependent enzyme